MADSQDNKATGLEQNFPKAGAFSDQGGLKKIDPAKPIAVSEDDTLHLKVLAPIGSNHFTLTGKHATHDVDGKQVHFNEFNPGLGLAVKTSKDAEIFAAIIQKNSFNDLTVMGGVQYVPFKTTIKDVELGLGGAAGIAWTEHGSYAKQTSVHLGNFVPLASILATAQHVPSGIGVQANIVPPLGIKNSGVIAVALTKEFDIKYSR